MNSDVRVNKRFFAIGSAVGSFDRFSYSEEYPKYQSRSFSAKPHQSEHISVRDADKERKV